MRFGKRGVEPWALGGLGWGRVVLEGVQGDVEDWGYREEGRGRGLVLFKGSNFS